MEHKKSTDFVVTPPVGNQNLEARAECLKHIEPAVRAAGQAINWDRFNSSFSSGELTDILSDDFERVQETVKKFVDKDNI